MAQAKNKTTQTDISVPKFIAAVEPESKRADAKALLSLFKKVTGLKPKMWGPTMVGFGRYHYKYESGREGEFFLTGFSPRKQNLSIYIMPGYQFGDMKEMLAQNLDPEIMAKPRADIRLLTWIKRYFAKADVDKSGYITYDEFHELMKSDFNFFKLSDIKINMEAIAAIIYKRRKREEILTKLESILKTG